MCSVNVDGSAAVLVSEKAKELGMAEQLRLNLLYGK